MSQKYTRVQMDQDDSIWEESEAPYTINCKTEK